MILELYINETYAARLTKFQVNRLKGFNNAVGHFHQIYGLKNKRWYILVFNDNGRFEELYCPVKENLPYYITVPSIFPEILD